MSCRDDFAKGFQHATELGLQLDKEMRQPVAAAKVDEVTHTIDAEVLREVESEAQIANEEILEKEYDFEKEQVLRTRHNHGRGLHGGRHHGEGRHHAGKGHHGRWGRHGGRHGRHHGGGFMHGVCTFMHYFCFGILMSMYLCCFKRFCRNLKQLTDLKNLEASTEGMDDLEKQATLNAAAKSCNKKCKRVVKKQLKN